LVSFVPSRPDLDALLARAQGDLRDEPYRLLLLAIARQGKSGVLTLARGPLEKDVVFDAGAAVDCQSNIATESLERFLVSSGRISEGQRPDVLPAAELTRAMLQNLGRKLLEPFSWTSGTWQFSSDGSPAEAAHRVRIPQLIVTGIVKVEPFETIESALQDAGAMQLSIGASPLFDVSELRLSEEQQRLLGAIREGATLEQFAANEDLQRFVFALLVLGIAAPAAERAAPFFELDLPPEEKPAPRPLPVEAPPPVQPAPQFAPSNEVLTSFATYKQKDAFELLGLESDAGAVEINRAFVRAAERFLPSRYEEQVRDKAQELLLASARAYAELADPTRRQALIDRRTQKPAAAAAPAPPPAPTPAPAPALAAPRPTPTQRRRAIIDPEALYREGRAAAAAGKLRDALGYYEMAADCDAQNGTYAAEVAYARYQLLNTPSTTTMKALKNAIRIDPRCGVAYLYLGKIQEALGNHVEAQAYLGRASSLGAR